MLKFKLILVGLATLCSIVGSATGDHNDNAKIINCYWGTWSHYRPGNGAFRIENIDPNLCTHISYTFEGIDQNGNIRVLDDWLDMPSGLNNIANVIALKKVNPKLKVIAVVGGWNEGSAKYSQMAADPVKRKTFVQSALKFIQEHGFDGLDLDWEYPAQREGSSPNDKANFVILLKEIYQALKPHGYLFGIAVGASPENAEISYQLPEISKYLDFINVMTYDYSTWVDGKVGYNAPLRGQGVNNVESSMKFWLSKGVPASKLIMGLAFYGHNYKLAGAQHYRLGAPSSGPGAAGPYTRQPGFLGYNEICTMKASYTYEWAKTEHVPVLYNSNDLISYDNVESIAMKLDLANLLNLAGVMIWSIETDDFRGLCGTKNILLKTINNKMGNPQDMSTSGNENLNVEKPAAPKPNAPNQPNKPVAAGNCLEDGLYPHESDCTQYIQCVGGVGYTMPCASGLHFDHKSGNCNWPEASQCQ